MQHSDRTGGRAATAGAPRVTFVSSEGQTSDASEDSSAPTTDPRVERERPIARVNGRADAPDPHAAASVPERDGVRRVFDERTGDEWLVFERDARRVPGTRGPRCLFFDGEGIVRRVWHFPPDWQTLPAAALLALMDRPPLGDV